MTKHDETAPTRSVGLPALLTAVFPRTVARMRRLDELKRKIDHVEFKYRMFGQTNFGCTGHQLTIVHFGLAMDFEKLRYWWMKPINPMKPVGR